MSEFDYDGAQEQREDAARVLLQVKNYPEWKPGRLVILCASTRQFAELLEAGAMGPALTCEDRFLEALRRVIRRDRYSLVNVPSKVKR